MGENVPKSYTDCIFKLNFLISSTIFSSFDVATDASNIQKEATEATCEIVSEDSDDANCEIQQNSRKFENSERRLLKTRFHLEDIPSILNQLVEDETIGWTKPAFIRFLHVVNQTYECVEKDFSNFYIALVAEKMKLISSDEKFISECYIHPEDITKFREDEKFGHNPKIQYFRTNYNVDLSFPKIKEILFKFYDFSNFLSLNCDLKMGNYKFKTKN